MSMMVNLHLNVEIAWMTRLFGVACKDVHDTMFHQFVITKSW